MYIYIYIYVYIILNTWFMRHCAYNQMVKSAISSENVFLVD